MRDNKSGRSGEIEGMFFYESFAGEFDSKMNRWDPNKCPQVVLDELLTEDTSGKYVLGLSWSKRWAFTFCPSYLCCFARY
jgi:hypothetical protein